MANVLIRNLDEKTVRTLKERAAKNGRSLQAEMVAILEGAAARDSRAVALARLDRVREELAKYIQPGGPTGVEILREERDKR